MQEAAKVQQYNRWQRAEKIAHKLEKIGCGKAEHFLQVLAPLAETKAIGRPHFAQLLVEQGYFNNVEQAFRKALGDNKAAFVKQVWPGLDQAVHWITASGGIAIIAHPDKYRMTRRKLCCFIEEFCAVGGSGLEVLCARQTPDVTNKLTEVTKLYNLVASVGSDFHSPKQHWLKLGMHRQVPGNCRSILELLDLPSTKPSQQVVV